jgi:hypothetical protein
MRERPTLYVVCRYATDRLYGGPEEGGWWYTAGDLEKVVLSTRDEQFAWYAVRRLNDARQPMQREFVGYTVVELPRDEILPEYQRYLDYGDADEMWDEHGNILPGYRQTRWDVPTYFPERRPYYS